jgi:hypothetical protein
MSQSGISDRYLSSGLAGTGGIDSGLKSMLGDDSIEVGRHVCVECNKTFEGRAYPLPSNPKSLLCVEHYTKYASKCVGCSQAIFGQYAKNSEGKWHPQCVQDHFCDRCRKPIFGQVLVAESKNFHPTCFTCCLCNQRLTDSYTLHKDDMYCVKCSKELGPVRSTSTSKTSSIETILAKKEAIDRQNDLKDFRSKVEQVCIDFFITLKLYFYF